MEAANWTNATGCLFPIRTFLTTFNEWSQIQTGILPWLSLSYDAKPRYIRNGRDLAEYVHYDFSYQAYLNAALIC